MTAELIDLSTYRGDATMTEDREESRTALAKRLQELRRSLGYETAASFAREIGYPPDKYRRYERRGIACSGALVRLAQTIETSGHGQVELYWLFGFSSGPMFLSRGPQKRPPLRVVH